MSISTYAPCVCCADVNDHIASHLDPDATLVGDEHASEVLDELTACLDETAQVTVDQFARYLSTLRIRTERRSS